MFFLFYSFNVIFTNIWTNCYLLFVIRINNLTKSRNLWRVMIWFHKRWAQLIRLPIGKEIRLLRTWNKTYLIRVVISYFSHKIKSRLKGSVVRRSTIKNYLDWDSHVELSLIQLRWHHDQVEGDRKVLEWDKMLLIKLIKIYHRVQVNIFWVIGLTMAMTKAISIICLDRLILYPHQCHQRHLHQVKMLKTNLTIKNKKHSELIS